MQTSLRKVVVLKWNLTRSNSYLAVTFDPASVGSYYGTANIFITLATNCGGLMKLNNSANASAPIVYRVSDSKASVELQINRKVTYLVDVSLGTCTNGSVLFNIQNSDSTGSTGSGNGMSNSSVSFMFLFGLVMLGIMFVGIATGVMALIIVCVRRQVRQRAMNSGHELNDIKYQHVSTASSPHSIPQSRPYDTVYSVQPPPMHPLPAPLPQPVYQFPGAIPHLPPPPHIPVHPSPAMFNSQNATSGVFPQQPTPMYQPIYPQFLLNAHSLENQQRQQ